MRNIVSTKDLFLWQILMQKIRLPSKLLHHWNVNANIWTMTTTFLCSPLPPCLFLTLSLSLLIRESAIIIILIIECVRLHWHNRIGVTIAFLLDIISSVWNDVMNCTPKQKKAIFTWRKRIQSNPFYATCFQWTHNCRHNKRKTQQSNRINAQLINIYMACFSYSIWGNMLHIAFTR